MTRPDFFPDLAFGWAFYLVLVALLGVASVIDFRSFWIPKWLTVGCLTLGALFNMGRGLWLGLLEKPVWKLGVDPGPWLGTLDGFLFSLAGFATGFALFFALWFLKAAGGGDVKLVAAVGAWVGPWWMVFLMIGSTMTLLVVSMVWMAASLLGFGFARAQRSFSAQENKKIAQGLRPKHRGMTYSFPLAFATAVLLLILLAPDLGLSSRANGAVMPEPVSQAR